MFLNHITVLNYRNIAECDIEFSPKINCFLGKNGMGKTNILDVIYYLSFCKSHLNNIDSQIIKHYEDFFMIQGEYIVNGQTENISCAVKHRRKKQFLRNKKEYEKLAEHIGFVPLVLASPADSSLIAEGSSERRRFMDIVISQYNRQYLDNLMIYNSLLQSRNALLKNPEKIDDAFIEILEEKLCSAAEPIFECRQKFIEDFTPVFRNFYQKISSHNETVELIYISHLQQITPLKEQFFQTRKRDKILGYTTNGIHKDDLKMMLQNFPLKNTGSQGQNKSYVVAMKLAQFCFLKNASGKKPILLLDDLFDKLDTERVTKIVNLISQDEFGQIFITDTNREHLNEVIKESGSDFRLFEMENGVVHSLYHEA
ncbi:MAG: DNA replication and repair protein RecF [Prevotellaceae bacterium]|jgi:DNA replication and repair protein RecF|nr:DNA replication and repair protein RecF [Prevotellaceae bacterium]